MACVRAAVFALVLLGPTGLPIRGDQTRDLGAEVCIVGGGSGGYAAAIAAARAGADCILVERQGRLGGTSTAGYVCNWEPGPGGPLAREIYERMSKMPGAVGIVRDRNPDRDQGPFGLWLPDATLNYADTLRRAGVGRDLWRAVTFEPEALGSVVTEMLAETGRCRILLRTTFVGVRTRGRRIVSIRAESDDGASYGIGARVFIDATGDVHLCRAAGFETMLGSESKDRFGEPHAPDEPDMTLNAISLCYRIRKSENPERQAPPDPPVANWPKTAHVSGLPNGDRIVNPLPVLPGRALIDLGYDEALARAGRIVAAHWRWLQGYPAFAEYERHSVAPMLGIRESYRVVGEYVLRQQDLLAGLAGQDHPDAIAVADHSMDVHGAGGRRVHGELKGPYGIPYRCLIPKGSENLLVACRGASFSHVAASSCRLSRTMIQLGRAAGLAAAQAVERDIAVGAIDVGLLQEALGVE